ncbi:MAG: hypothetical protein C4K60_12115 [Ideonella sp. MAG2]|nr:MAG: hypothetical protein C4K60_12115 [Ideonella sp. MAG2]
MLSWHLQRKNFRRQALPELSAPVTIAPCQFIHDGAGSEARLIKMLGSALAEALECLDGESEPLNGLTVMLLLPKHMTELARQTIAQQMQSWLGASVTCKILVGASGLAWQALAEAYAMLEGAGRPKRLVLATVDSYCLPEYLLSEATLGRLHAAGNGEGYVAGEGAACLVLEPASSVGSLPAGRFALHRPDIRRVQRIDQQMLEPNAADLVGACSQALALCGMQPEHIGNLVSDSDGSAWRSRWEVSLQLRLTLGRTQHLRPPELLGQTGTCTGLSSWAMTLALDQLGLSRVNTALTWSLGPEGLIAANVIERSPH